ncbi:MAG: DNA polymerase [Fimbriimonadales bacterium]
MVDAHLPIELRERPLRYLFLDLNSYFASVEQQEYPELRGKPVAVVPVDVDTSFVIAASYEAKRFGVKTLTQIGEAKRLCPELICVTGHHSMYAHYHKRVIEVAETVLPVDQVCSIDEMRFRLLKTESPPEITREIALKMKRTIREQVGQCLTCSIGIAPNSFLAKVGTELQKPDGLVIIEAKDLPDALHRLDLTGFPGINRRMEVRLNAQGIFTSEQMCAASREHMHRAFGSVIGERWWYLLRGFDLPMAKTERKSLGHSHVLPPEHRTEKGCREVLLRLLQKASARLRKEDLWTEEMVVAVKGFKKSWEKRIKLPPTQDTVTLNEFFLKEWPGHDFVQPKMVAVTFTRLLEHEQVTPSLFDPTFDRSLLSKAVDTVNKKFGKNKIYLAGMEHAKETAEERIAFGKTELFSEGKGDNEWVDTFRGLPRSSPADRSDRSDLTDQSD